MARAWGTIVNGTQLTLTSAYQTVQESSVDWELTLDPGDIAQITFEFTPEADPEENCDIIVPVTADGTLYESEGEAQRYILEYANPEGDDPVVRSITISGVYGFKIRARQRDTDDSPGTNDTTNALDVDVLIGTPV